MNIARLFRRESKAEHFSAVNSLSLLLLLFAAMLMFSNSTHAWTKFTEEELQMEAPEWCPDANAIILDKSIEGEVYLSKYRLKLIEYHSIRIKILTEDGKEHGTFPIDVPYDHKLSNIRARTISKTGKVTKVRKKQIIRKRIYGGIDNSRRFDVYQIAFPDVQVGAILELTYESKSENVYFMAPYYLDIRGIPTQKSHLTFTIPGIVSYLKSGMNTDFYEFEENIEQIKMLKVTKQIKYSATASKINTYSDQPFAPYDDLVRPHIYFVFSHLDFGFQKLDIIPNWTAAVGIIENRLDSFFGDKNLGSDYSDRIASSYPEESKSFALYRWVTDSIQWVDSRYWQEFEKLPSEVVAERHATGMEKAITLVKLYRDSGLPARLLLLNPVNQSRTMTRLPTPLQFTTYLIQTRLNGQFIYLDPTKPHTTFGQYPWYFDGASALVIDSTYADMIKIPGCNTLNVDSWDLKGTIDSSGNLKAQGTLTLTNQYCMNYRNVIAESDSAELVDLVESMVSAENDAEFQSCDFLEEQATDSSVQIAVELNIPDYADLLENDMLFRPNFIHWMELEYEEENEERIADIMLSHPKRSIVTIETAVPEDYMFVDDPKRIRLMDIPEIQYRVDIIPNPEASCLLYRRVYMRDTYHFPGGYYKGLCEFWRKSGEYDRQEIALSRKPASGEKMDEE